MNAKTCVFYKDLCECHCNNEPDNPGDCVYESGYPFGNESVTCRYYKAPAPPVSIADQLIRKLLINQMRGNNEYIHPCTEWCACTESNNTPLLNVKTCHKCCIFTENDKDECLFTSTK